MQNYSVQSRRKHFYTCSLCSYVYITLESLQKHYLNVHPENSCDAKEYDSGI